MNPKTVLWSNENDEDPQTCVTYGPAIFTEVDTDQPAVGLIIRDQGTLILTPPFGNELLGLCYALGMAEIEAQTSDEDTIDFLMRQVASALDFLEKRR